MIAKSCNTKVLIATNENIEYAAKLLNDGDVVGMPTETVYGLAANAFDENAVEKIFIAKGRPQDNPLIVHISKMDMLDGLVSEVPDVARLLAKKFWPGPLTMIFKKSDRVPSAVTANMNTVAVRYPSHKVALALIEKAGLPLAAPSANISGRPSPTTASHVFDDMNGKIPAILDGGACEYGLESTVIFLNDESHITLLRPGAVTVNMLKEVIPFVTIDKGVLEEIKENEQAQSPGMKHMHYSPKSKVIILNSSFEKFIDFIKKHSDENIGAMVFDGEEKELNVPFVTFGRGDDEFLQAKLLFSALRAIDRLNVSTIYARMPSKDGIGLAIYNRLIRAAGFEVITL